MSDNLQTTLNNLIHSGVWSNPAMSTLINDYTQYHLVLVAAGGLLVIMFLLLSIFWGVRLKRAPKADTRKWTFEEKVYFSFGALSLMVGALFALIVLANATNVVDPHHGFTLLVDSLGTPNAGTQKYQLYQAFNTWIQSGIPNVPAVAQNRFLERISFHSTKALVSGVLMVVFIVVSIRIWNLLIKQSKANEAKWRLKENALLISGVATISFSLLLLVIVLANMQAAVAPIALTLLYG
ncbi:MAG: hypothetical protein J0M07_22225 [Anaerolineae bacterium]|nr:hypothetical protein [Anaerolineae bacterium]